MVSEVASGATLAENITAEERDLAIREEVCESNVAVANFTYSK
jgi:hypothetical protein